MRAVVRTEPQESAATKKRLRETLRRPGWPRRGAGNRWTLLLNGGTLAPPAARGSGSFYYPLRKGCLNQLDIDAGVRLLSGSWSRAFVSYCASLVAEAGALTVPIYNERAEAKGQLTERHIERYLGRPVEVSPAPTVGGPQLRAKASVDAAPLTIHSTLTWYLANAREVLATHASSSGRDDIAESFLSLPPRLAPDTAVAPVASGAESFLKQQAYYIGGIAYKAPLLAHIVRTCVATSGRLTVTDVGGGYGLLVTELLADAECPVQAATVIDHSAVNRALSDLLTRWLQSCGHPAFFFRETAIEDEEQIPESDVVVAVGSLLYVPRSSLSRVLDRMWGAVRPGGTLVVHENIKARSYVRDYAVMFEPDELDGYLQRYGPIRYFASSATVELQPERVRRASAFRVIERDS